MKWKIATASALTAAIVSAPIAGAAPSNGNGITGPGNAGVGQAISQIAAIASGGATPGAILNALNTVKGVLEQIKQGKRTHGSGRGALLQQQTQAGIGRTLKPRPLTDATTPGPARLPEVPPTP